MVLIEQKSDLAKDLTPKKKVKREYPWWINEHSLLSFSILSFSALLFLLGLPLLISLLISFCLLFLQLRNYVKSNLEIEIRIDASETEKQLNE